ncbi:MAG: hypothetical protein ACI85U_002320 [Candidatus Promineifilaceae bacterium]|jgi:hypothetical protein
MVVTADTEDMVWAGEGMGILVEAITAEVALGVFSAEHSSADARSADVYRSHFFQSSFWQPSF